MPLIQIQASLLKDQSAREKMFDEIREVGALVLQCPTSNIWISFQVSEEKILPPIVTIKAKTGRSPSQRMAFVSAVAEVVARHLSIDEKNIWIYYQEMKPEDIWFNGRWDL